MNKNSVNKFRSFIIVIHQKYGCLLLKSSKKSEHDIFQLPGGRLDEKDLIINQLEMNNDDYNIKTHILPKEDSFKVAAARELYEETGMDFRNRLHMLKPLEFDLPKKWKFFYLDITNTEITENQCQNKSDRNCYFKPFQKIAKYFISILYTLNNCFNTTNFHLKLSKEHESFLFEKDLVKASQLVQSHSKGICSKALLLFKQNYQT
ncbi:uncharacterized protein cubi_03687 [Cryptosporidium ubiquitum]|uniref:Nudix hydrolase domain-containing protein n=1 Tax=Cryptosporidium ubiquitum TaxID=857276 RepID=A0A1J4MF37_9CRYT|nr:uncharacterized protein cubi_03687 [Cryptosporidium ubiquitum]OII72817.1 hypothetical protein cubi_03687 [Cryptosporidium ubiquitum]